MYAFGYIDYRLKIDAFFSETKVRQSLFDSIEITSFLSGKCVNR